MDHFCSNIFAFSPSSFSRTHSSNCMHSLHVGSGIPSISPQSDFPDESYKSACSSMCSAASTVASALCSIEASVSFPSSSETKFDLARHLTFRLNEEQESRKRRCDSEEGWQRLCSRNAPSERHGHDSFANVYRFDQNSSLDFGKRKGCISGTQPDLFPPESQQHSLEEFSLGSGDPYAASDVSIAPRNNKIYS
jgi:hypothetical protein